MGTASATSHLAVVTDGATLDSHAQQPSAVALTDLHSEMLLPAVIAVCVAALHGGGCGDRHIAETAVALYVSRDGYCMYVNTISASWRSGRHSMVSLVGDNSLCTDRLTASPSGVLASDLEVTPADRYTASSLLSASVPKQMEVSKLQEWSGELCHS